MKKIFILLVVVTLFGACAGGKGRVNFKKPESVSLAFIKSIIRLDIAGAKRYATDDTQSVLGMLETLTESLPQKDKDEMMVEAAEDAKLIKKATCVTNDDTATCNLCCGRDGESANAPIKLKKVGKKWLVDMGKEELMSGKK